MEKPQINEEAFKDLQKKFGLSNTVISEAFGYKNRASYYTSPKRQWVENGITKVVEAVEENFTLINSDEAEALIEILQAHQLAGGLNEVEAAALEKLNK